MAKRIVAVLAVMALVMMTSSMLVAQEKKEVKVVVKTGDDVAPACMAAKPLTEEQKAKADALREEHRLRVVELRADLTKLGVELKREMDKTEPNMGAVEAIVKKMSAVKERIQMNGIEHRLAMRKLLGNDYMGHMGWRSDDRGPMWVEIEEEGDVSGERDVRVMRFGDRECPGMMEGMRSGHVGRGDMGGRGMMGGRDPGSCRMMMSHKSGAPMACCAEREGRHCTMRAGKGRACEGSCMMRKGNWDSRMFRPRGKRTAHKCSGECMPMECKELMPAERR